MKAVITAPFTPAHAQSLPSTVIQSGKQFHCWKLKINSAFLDFHWMNMVYPLKDMKYLSEGLLTLPIHQFRLNYCILLDCSNI